MSGFVLWQATMMKIRVWAKLLEHRVKQLGAYNLQRPAWMRGIVEHAAYQILYSCLHKTLHIVVLDCDSRRACLQKMV